MGQHEEALRWLRPVMAWAERRFAEKSSADRGEWVGWASWDLGEIAAADQQTNEALNLLNRAKELLDAAGMAEWDAKSWSELNQRIDQLRQ